MTNTYVQEMDAITTNVVACTSIQVLLNGQRLYDPEMKCEVHGHWDYNTINSLNKMVKALFDVTVDINPIFGDDAGNYMRWYDKLQATVTSHGCMSLYDNSEYRKWGNDMLRCFEHIVLLWRCRIMGLKDEFFNDGEAESNGNETIKRAAPVFLNFGEDNIAELPADRMEFYTALHRCNIPKRITPSCSPEVVVRKGRRFVMKINPDTLEVMAIVVYGGTGTFGNVPIHGFHVHKFVEDNNQQQAALLSEMLAAIAPRLDLENERCYTYHPHNKTTDTEVRILTGCGFMTAPYGSPSNPTGRFYYREI